MFLQLFKFSIVTTEIKWNGMNGVSIGTKIRLTFLFIIMVEKQKVILMFVN